MAAAQRKHICELYPQAGDLIRDEIKSRTPLGISVEQKIAAGHLLEDDVVFDLVSKRIGQSDVAETGAVLDGFPRSVAQAERLEELTRVELVVNLAMREDALVAKLLGRCALLPPASLFPQHENCSRPQLLFPGAAGLPLKPHPTAHPAGTADCLAHCLRRRCECAHSKMERGGEAGRTSNSLTRQFSPCAIGV
jgi:adenylate kinase